MSINEVHITLSEEEHKLLVKLLLTFEDAKLKELGVDDGEFNLLYLGVAEDYVIESR